jgi:hypothetical protein
MRMDTDNLSRPAPEALSRLAPLLGASIAAFVASIVSPSHAPRNFFEIGSQILVVLILAFLFQTRMILIRVPLPPEVAPVAVELR